MTNEQLARRHGAAWLTAPRGGSNGPHVDTVRSAVEAPSLTATRQIVLKALGPHAVRIFLCGSRARGDAGPLSDIDIAILPLNPLPPGVLSDLREALEESTIPYDVDIIDLGTVDEVFRNKVMSEGIAWNA